MPRIPESEIERIKRETDLAALVRSRGIELKPHGSKDLAGKCPFHPDDQPSFIVTPDKGLWHCMGCGVAGNCIQFVQKFDGVSFRHAFEILAGGRAFTAAGTAPVKQSSVPRLDLPFDPKESDDKALLGQVVDYYHERLLKTPAALDYLKGRGLGNDAAIKKFRLGVADRTLGLRIPDANRKAGAEIRKRLQKLGIYRKNGREHMNGRVVLPIPCPDGRMKLYGRLFSKPNPDTPKHLYLPGPHEKRVASRQTTFADELRCQIYHKSQMNFPALTNEPDIVAAETGRVFVAKTPEQFNHDADGNQLQDGRFNYSWDCENRLIGVETRTGAVPGNVPRIKVQRIRVKSQHSTNGTK